MKHEVLRIDHLSHRINGILVLNNVSLTCYSGDVLGLVGLTGSGRSTISRILSGILTKQAGNIYLDGRELNLQSISEAQNAGIFYIQKRTNVIQHLDLAANFTLPEKFGKRILCLPKEEWALLRLMTACFDMEDLVEIRPEEMSNVQLMIYEAMRAIVCGAKILLFDPFLSRCSEEDYQRFKTFLRKALGMEVSVVLTESVIPLVWELADHILVMQYGNTVGLLYRGQSDPESVKTALTSRAQAAIHTGARPIQSEVLLQLDHVSTYALTDISFHLHSGECLGVHSRDGNSYAKLIDCICGKDALTAGALRLWNGSTVRPRERVSRTAARIGYFSDYSRELFMNHSVQDNLTMAASTWDRSTFGLRFRRRERFIAQEYARQIGIAPQMLEKDVKYADYETKLKVALYKWIAAKARVLIIENPFVSSDLVMYNIVSDFIRRAKAENIGILYIAPQDDVPVDAIDRHVML